VYDDMLTLRFLWFFSENVSLGSTELLVVIRMM
jgi:hypothetical protein